MRAIDIENIVYNFETKYEFGFVSEEIDKILVAFKGISRTQLNSAIGVVTGTEEDGEQITYKSDLISGLCKILFHHNSWD